MKNVLTGTLTDSWIHDAPEAASLVLEREGVEERIRLCSRLALEELLLICRDSLGENAAAAVRSWKANGDLVLEIRVAGEKLNPFTEPSFMMERLLPNFDVPPRWSYDFGRNRVLFRYRLRNTTLKSFAFTWSFIRRFKHLVFFSCFFQGIGGIFSVAAPVVSASIIHAYASDEASRVIYIALALLIIQLLKNLFTAIGNQSYNRLYSRTLSAVEEELVRNMLRVENRCIDEKGSGLFIQRLTTDTERISSGFNNLADMITQLINYIGILIAMLIVDYRICLIVLILIVIQCVVEKWRTRRLRRDDRLYRNAKERYSGLVGEMVRGQKDVKFLNSEEQFSSELNARIEKANDQRLFMQRRSWNLKLLRAEIGEFGSFAIIALLTYLIATKMVLPSIALILYNYYSDLGPNAVKLVSSFMDSMADFNLSCERVSAILNDREFPKEEFGDTELREAKGEITFDHVDFSYNRYIMGQREKLVLKDISFTIHPGERVALVGKSGCGKSTVFNLIDKLYEAKNGKVMLDGVDVRDLTRDSVRNNITIVSQNPYIFHMSVRDNLRITKEDATDEELEEVCRLACIDEDIRNMPDGYDTILGEGGVNISGGQRQRMAIARAMLRNSRVILFDEATSALDNVTQAKIQEAIDNLQNDRTVVLIAHRLSTVIHSDRILYMQDGKILAEGTHARLLEICPPYRELAAMEVSVDSGKAG